MDLIPTFLSLVSYYAVAVCLGSVPLTHAVGVYMHCPKPARPWRYLLFPFTGGNRHVIMQFLGWVSDGVQMAPTLMQAGELLLTTAFDSAHVRWCMWQ